MIGPALRWLTFCVAVVSGSNHASAQDLVELPDSNAPSTQRQRQLFYELQELLNRSSCDFQARVEQMREAERIDDAIRIFADLSEPELYAVERACAAGLNGLMLEVNALGRVSVVAPNGYLSGPGLLILSADQTLNVELPVAGDSGDSDVSSRFSHCEGSFAADPSLEVIATRALDVTWFYEGDGALSWSGPTLSCQPDAAARSQQLAAVRPGRWFVHPQQGSSGGTLRMVSTPGPAVPAGFAGIVWDGSEAYVATGETSSAEQERSPQGDTFYCAGFVPQQASLQVFIAREEQIEIVAASTSDLVLVVRDAEGEIWCNDDTYGLNPAVEGRFPAGVLDVYVGTYSQITADWALELR